MGIGVPNEIFYNPFSSLFKLIPIGATGFHLAVTASCCPHPESNVRDSIVKEKKAARNLKLYFKRFKIIYNSP